MIVTHRNDELKLYYSYHRRRGTSSEQSIPSHATVAICRSMCYLSSTEWTCIIPEGSFKMRRFATFPEIASLEEDRSHSITLSPPKRGIRPVTAPYAVQHLAWFGQYPDYQSLVLQGPNEIVCSIDERALFLPVQ